MKRESFVCWIVIVIHALLPLALTAQIVELWSGWTQVMGGEYIVNTNIWGATTAQCLEVDLSGAYFKVTHSEHNNTGPSPAAYPFIYKGCHWGKDCTTIDNIMPMKINEIASAPFTWEIDVEGVGGTWNAAFEAFFDSTGFSSSSDYKGELMIWINFGGGAGPGGSRKTTVEIGGHEWDLYYAAAANWNNLWNYIAYKIKNVTTEVDLDLRDFIHDAVTRGYLDEEWYMHNMEAGFEIWRDGEGLTTYSYSADVIEGEYTPIVSSSADKPTFYLGQNCPNPFNPTTTIAFEIPQSEFVTLKVYDILGKEVITLVNENKTVGKHQIRFDARHIPSGVYLYKLQAGDFTNIKKLVLNR